jgi:hypothetical protein
MAMLSDDQVRAVVASFATGLDRNDFNGARRLLAEQFPAGLVAAVGRRVV